jgi:hypothetical protein
LLAGSIDADGVLVASELAAPNDAHHAVLKRLKWRNFKWAICSQY